jgi:hypothetical protein
MTPPPPSPRELADPQLPSLGYEYLTYSAPRRHVGKSTYAIPTTSPHPQALGEGRVRRGEGCPFHLTGALGDGPPPTHGVPAPQPARTDAGIPQPQRTPQGAVSNGYKQRLLRHSR